MKKLLIVFLLTALIFLSVTPNAIDAKAGTPDLISTSTSVVPEKAIYYVGETVNMTTNMTNRNTAGITNASLQFYNKNENFFEYDSDIHNLSNFGSKEKKSFVYTYTFVERDIGNFTIGSKIVFTYNGNRYEEFNSDYDFVVQAAPATPTATPVPTASPTPDPAAAQTANPANEITAAPADNAATPVPTLNPQPINEQQATSTAGTPIFEDNFWGAVNTFLITPMGKVVIIAGILLIIILLIQNARLRK